VAAVAVRCLVEDGRAGAYSPTGPEALDHARIAEVLGEVLGRPITHRCGLLRYGRLARRAGVPAGPALRRFPATSRTIPEAFPETSYDDRERCGGGWTEPVPSRVVRRPAARSVRRPRRVRG
jgi:hypothetical protein